MPKVALLKYDILSAVLPVLELTYGIGLPAFSRDVYYHGLHRNNIYSWFHHDRCISYQCGTFQILSPRIRSNQVTAIRDCHGLRRVCGICYVHVLLLSDRFEQDLHLNNFISFRRIIWSCWRLLSFRCVNLVSGRHRNANTLSYGLCHGYDDLWA